VPRWIRDFATMLDDLRSALRRLGPAGAVESDL